MILRYAQQTAAGVLRRCEVEGNIAPARHQTWHRFLPGSVAFPGAIQCGADGRMGELRRNFPVGQQSLQAGAEAG